MSFKCSLKTVLLYLLTGVVFGHGLVTLITGERTDWVLIFIGWMAAAVLLVGNYRRLTRQTVRG